ncbi:hypothetical protein B296_00005305 [Ensete ventricosum]|uniref:Uncharacterized protein n=1 Tax=Ensete ventricosum TaxID=4639 RepID=A0A427AVC2_ENSVE|nr:hypothetical protein B296_00005305 [Ensete ventricosum]
MTAVNRGKGAALVQLVKEEDGNNDCRGGLRLRRIEEKGAIGDCGRRCRGRFVSTMSWKETLGTLEDHKWLRLWQLLLMPDGAWPGYSLLHWHRVAMMVQEGQCWSEPSLADDSTMA